MEKYLLFFENMTSEQKLSWIFICLGISWLLEFGTPLVKMAYGKWKHAGVNLVFLLCSLLINLLFGIVIAGVFVFIEEQQYGLLHILQLPIWAELLIAVLFLDLIAQYVVHYLLHKINFMWRFHMVHHSDTHVDATTGTRHHPGDYLMREVFGLVAIVLLGAPLAFYVFYKICTILFTYFSHANISLPKRVDKALSLVFITPDMHKFHHHFEMPWTDKNYGNIFSIWDRTFGTFIYGDPKKVVYGLDVLDDSKDESLAYQFKVPFNKEINTDYWDINIHGDDAH